MMGEAIHNDLALAAEHRVWGYACGGRNSLLGLQLGGGTGYMK